MMKASPLVLSLAIFMLLLSQLPVPAVATICSVSKLMPCAAAVYGSGKPSRLCCTTLRRQQPCFCSYINNPRYRAHIKHRQAKKILKECRLHFPKCGH
ncbi:Lipid transfer protein [Zostera marina]|uniref:Lipid transfer protein n=1 Tax=Zostera marina TaxID=29655 RepID=A0A0K9Q3N7_ZOSMR|nr:Lipid transfer protein [Zostera marina]